MLKIVVPIFYIFFISGCSGPFVTVKGIVKNHLDQPIEGATVQILDTVSCCAHEDKPCQYTTNTEGRWSLVFLVGENKDVTEFKISCGYRVSKDGYQAIERSFDYCEIGPCSGEQTITTEITISP